MKTFTVNLFSERLNSKTCNISSTNGQRQGRETRYCSYVDVFYTDKCNFIYIRSNNRMTVSEADFGSYSNDNFTGYLYIAKDSKDHKEALNTLRNGGLPDGVFKPKFMVSFDEETYFRGNSFPIQFYIMTDEKCIESALKTNTIAINVEYFDSFEFDDHFLTTPDEHLPCNFYLNLTEFIDITTNSQKRVKILWEKLNINHYNYIADGDEITMLKHSNFGGVIRQALIDLTLNDDTEDLNDRVNILKNKVASIKKIEKEKEERAVESNKKWTERNGQPAWIPPQIGEPIESSETAKIIGKISIKQLKDSVNQDSKKNYIKVLNKIHKDYFKTGKYCSYENYIKYIIEKIVNPFDSVDLDYGMLSLGKLYASCDKSEVPKSTEVSTIFFSTMAKNLGLAENIFDEILNLPIKTIISTVSVIYKELNNK